MDAQMKRGVLEMCILYQFASADYYGYDMMEKMRPYFPDVNDSTYYIILRRLCSEGYTEVYLGDTSHGPQRKYYRITPEGRRYLEEAIKHWNQMKSVVESIGI